VTVARAGDVFTLRPMVEADLEQVGAIEEQWAPTPWSRQVFRNELLVPFSHAMVAHVTGRPESVAGYRVRWAVAGEIHLLSLAVAPAQRRRGLGGLLLDELLAAARGGRDDLVTLEVEASNSVARRLYASRGFHEVRRREHYYGAGRDAVVMELRFACRDVS